MRRTISVVLVLATASWIGAVSGGSVAHGSTPGSNGTIVFGGDAGSGFQLYTIQPDGTGLTQLTHLDGDALSPDWSPDGTRIVFELDQEDAAHVMVMSADGSNMVDLTPSGFQGQPAFTPDGLHVVYDCDCNPQGVYMIGVDGTGRHRVTTQASPDQLDTDANVSPDGSTITFVRIKAEHELQALYAVDPDGANVRRLTPYKLEVAIKHDWAPDGGRILISRNADYPHHSSPNVATMAADGSDLKMLTHYKGGAKGAFAGSYSPDGTQIVFRVENVGAGSFKLFRMATDGSGRTLIADLPFAPRFVDWGPLP